jgi:hypothetical protein
VRKILPLILLLATGAFAQGFLDFNMNAVHPLGASISYAGGATPLVGTNIDVDDVTGVGTSMNAGAPVACVGCTLNFATGNFSGSTPITWSFAPGGAISIVGSIPTIGIANETILNGFLVDALVVNTGGDFKVVISTFFDDKHDALEAYFGLAGTPLWDGAMNLSFNAAGAPPGAFSSSAVLSGDVTNTPVPEPASMVLLGSSLLGVAIAIRKRRRAHSQA